MDYFYNLNQLSNMIKKQLLTLLTVIPFSGFAQLGVAINAGYNIPTGEHHSAYESDLLVKTDYDNKKSLTYCSSFKLDYTLRHVNFGLGIEYGNYQTKKETDISIISSFIPSTSFVAATSRYISPYAFVNYRTNISRKFTFQAGAMMGMFTAGLGKDNGIVVIETDAIFGLIPSQTIGAEVQTGSSGKSNSTKLVSGAQVEFGYHICKKLQVHIELAARNTNVDSKVSVSGIEQPLNYSLWNFSGRTGLRYTFKKLNTAATKANTTE
ncbi:MAG: hypothetical protein V4561_01575 [Bacteroidota bacterium]